MTDGVLQFLMREPIGEAPRDLESWWRRHQTACKAFDRPIEASLVSAFRCDRLSWVFGAAYHGALRHLFEQPAAPRGTTARRFALAVTEEGGVHPRAIETTFDHDRGIVGTKTFVTFGSVADTLLVLAQRPVADPRPDGQARKDFRILEVPADAAGVEVDEVHYTPFAPEIPHAVIRFDGVTEFRESKSDGWTWTKHFRTTEDLFVFGCVVAWFVRLGRQTRQADVTRRFLAILAATDRLVDEPPGLTPTHAAFDGLHAFADETVAAFDWSDVDEATHQAWERDRGLLQVASRAREARSKRAERDLNLTKE